MASLSLEFMELLSDTQAGYIDFENHWTFAKYLFPLLIDGIYPVHNRSFRLSLRMVLLLAGFVLYQYCYITNKLTSIIKWKKNGKMIELVKIIKI